MRMKLILIMVLYSSVALAQVKVDGTYQELPDPKPVKRAGWSALKPGVYVSFATADIRYDKHNAPAISPLQAQWKTKAWKGEKVHTQFLIWTTRNLKQLSFIWSKLKDGKGHEIPQKNINANFVRYVMADGLNNEGGGCGILPGHDSSLVEDVIDPVKMLPAGKNTTRPVWLSVSVPATAVEGLYRGNVKVIEGKNAPPLILHYAIQVLNHTLPAPEHWKFHLDLWQNPYSVARVYGVKPWSKQHFYVMRPYMKMLANTGQKVITTTLIHDPWNSQTYDIYGSMIKWTKNKNGSWRYDYSIFDKWVSFMMSLGINKLINCYSMIPWNLKFYYYDEALRKETMIVAKPGSAEYEAHWRPMLMDFARHLKEKGWFNKTTIAMDERSMADMQKAIALIKSADKNFKISLAGNYHPEIERDLFDYSVASNQLMDEATIRLRRESGLNTTYYTCCTEGYPNTFSFSAPAESVWLAWHAAYKGYDGYLRWAYNCWTKDPLRDTRFGAWSSGDAYLVYPGPRSSVRLERLIEGIQDFEKINILKEGFIKNNQQDKLLQLKNILEGFDIGELKNKTAAETLQAAQERLNSL
ncbi:hypothetical protein ABID99_001178 [Mucilaginibacter sp. OAE612]